MTKEKIIETIPENGVGDLLGEPVAAASARLDDFLLPQGLKGWGPTMLLCFLDRNEDLRVGIGSEFVAGGSRWKVTQVHLENKGQGWVQLEPQTSEDLGLVSAQQLDFIFDECCDHCTGRAGWDGSTDHALGRLAVGMQCTECPTKFWMTSGAVRRMFSQAPPLFQPGRLVEEDD